MNAHKGNRNGTRKGLRRATASPPPPPPAPHTGAHAVNRDEDKRSALIAIGNYSIALVTLETGILVIATTFLLPSYEGKGYALLAAAFVTSVVSLFFGSRVIGKQVTMLRRSQLEPSDPKLGQYGLIQILLLVVSLILFGVFGWIYVPLPGGPKPTSSTSSTSSSTRPAQTSQTGQKH